MPYLILGNIKRKVIKMQDKRTIFFIINALLGVMFIYQGARTYYLDKSAFGGILFAIFGLLELYFSYSIYKGKYGGVI